MLFTKPLNSYFICALHVVLSMIALYCSFCWYCGFFWLLLQLYVFFRLLGWFLPLPWWDLHQHLSPDQLSSLLEGDPNDVWVKYMHYQVLGWPHLKHLGQRLGNVQSCCQSALIYYRSWKGSICCMSHLTRQHWWMQRQLMGMPLSLACSPFCVATPAM